MSIYIDMLIGHAPFHKTRYLNGALFIIQQSNALFYRRGHGIFAYRDETDFSRIRELCCKDSVLLRVGVPTFGKRGAG